MDLRQKRDKGEIATGRVSAEKIVNGYLEEHPIATLEEVVKELKISLPTAKKWIDVVRGNAVAVPQRKNGIGRCNKRRKVAYRTLYAFKLVMKGC